jgi:hypothetical protein
VTAALRGEKMKTASEITAKIEQAMPAAFASFATNSQAMSNVTVLTEKFDRAGEERRADQTNPTGSPQASG